jgi:YegS/Rv2252/BmrU family lipid kinase
MQEIFIILNPSADRGGGGNAESRICQAMRQAGLDFQLERTRHPGDGIRLAQEARQAGYRWIAAAGGDGTINEVVNGMVQATPEENSIGCLIPIPVGSANDFSDSIGYPQDLNRLASLIQRGQTRHIDLCHAMASAKGEEISRYFVNNLGFGFEAKVTEESRKIHNLRGIFIYLAAVFRALRCFEQPHVSIQWTDELHKAHLREQVIFLISVGNGRRTGGSFYLTPDAVPDDGLFDMVIARQLTLFQILRLLPLTFFGAHRNSPHILLTRSSAIQIHSDLPAPMHTDGEIVGGNIDQVILTMHPRRIEILCPS